MKSFDVENGKFLSFTSSDHSNTQVSISFQSHNGTAFMYMKQKKCKNVHRILRNTHGRDSRKDEEKNNLRSVGDTSSYLINTWVFNRVQKFSCYRISHKCSSQAFFKTSKKEK